MTVMPSSPPPPSPRPIAAVELGLNWFAETPGGLDRYFADLVAHAAGAGVDARGLVVGTAAVAGQSGGRVTAYAAADAPLWRRWRAARAAVAAARAARPVDLFVSHAAIYALPVVSQLKGLPHVVHFHGPLAGEAEREGQRRVAVAAKRAMERYVYRSAERLIVLSEAFRHVLCDGYGVDPGRVRVVSGGVDVGRFDTGLSRAEARARLGWPAGRPVVLCVRRLVRRMGLLNLVGAVGRLRAAHPDLLCLIGGRGPIEAELRAAVAAAGLGDHVRLLGFVADDQLPVAYRAADLSVVPTEAWEGFGLVTVESLAAGTPAVVTPVGGLPEVVRPFAPGLVTADPTEAALAETLDGCLSGRVALPSDAECRSYARAHYGWPAVAARVADVYREVC